MIVSPLLSVWLLATAAMTAPPAAAPFTVAARGTKKRAEPAPESMPESLRASYAAMPVAARAALQFDLVWSGDYNGIANGEIGPRMIAAVKTWQQRHHEDGSGLLSPAQRAALAAVAQQRREAVGWRVVDDGATGARLGLPAKLAPQIAASSSGSRWSSVHGETTVETFRIDTPGTALATVFAEMRRGGSPQRQISYSVMRGNFFVISGLTGLKKFYTRAEIKNGEVRGVTIAYDQALESTMDKVAVAMSGAFTPFPAGVATLSGSPPQRPVVYATGLVVSRSGDILTDAQVVKGCRFISVAAHGQALPVARDEEAGLALLRVFPSSPLKPLRVATDAPAPRGAVRLAGIADPQSQQGGNAVSTRDAKLAMRDGEATVETATDRGFAGAAVLDAQNALNGLLQYPPGANDDSTFRVIPGARIAAFLAAHGITAEATTPAAKITDSLVRVICVRDAPEKE